MQLVKSFQRMPLLPTVLRTSRECRARLIDRRLGINTAPEHANVKAPLSQFNDHRENEAMDYPCIRALLRALDIGPGDVVYDIGCGTGRVLCVAARLGVKKCVGIELCDELAALSRENAQSLRSPKAPIDIQHTDAALADYSDGTVYCLFNSFGEKTLSVVLERIRQTLDEQPRRIRIGYACPDHEGPLHTCGWLRQYADLRFFARRYSVHLWESTVAW